MTIFETIPGLDELKVAVQDAPAFVCKAVAGGTLNVEASLKRLDAAASELGMQLTQMVSASHEDLLSNAASIKKIPEVLDVASQNISALHTEVEDLLQQLPHRRNKVESAIRQWESLTETWIYLLRLRRLLQNLLVAQAMEDHTDDENNLEWACKSAAGLEQVFADLQDEHLRLAFSKIKPVQSLVQNALSSASKLQTLAFSCCHNYCERPKLDGEEAEMQSHRHLRSALQISHHLNIFSSEAPTLVTLLLRRLRTSLAHATTMEAIEASVSMLTEAINKSVTIDQINQAFNLDKTVPKLNVEVRKLALEAIAEAIERVAETLIRSNQPSHRLLAYAAAASRLETSLSQLEQSDVLKKLTQTLMQKSIALLSEDLKVLILQLFPDLPGIVGTSPEWSVLVQAFPLNSDSAMISNLPFRTDIVKIAQTIRPMIECSAAPVAVWTEFAQVLAGCLDNACKPKAVSSPQEPRHLPSHLKLQISVYELADTFLSNLQHEMKPVADLRDKLSNSWIGAVEDVLQKSMEAVFDGSLTEVDGDNMVSALSDNMLAPLAHCPSMYKQILALQVRALRRAIIRWALEVPFHDAHLVRNALMQLIEAVHRPRAPKLTESPEWQAFGELCQLTQTMGQDAVNAPTLSPEVVAITCVQLGRSISPYCHAKLKDKLDCDFFEFGFVAPVRSDLVPISTDIGSEADKTSDWHVAAAAVLTDFVMEHKAEFNGNDSVARFLLDQFDILG